MRISDWSSDVCSSDLALDDHRRAAGKGDDVGIAHPIGRGNDHLVARIDRRDERVEQSMLAADVDRNLVEPEIEAVVAEELAAERVLQRARSVNEWIFGLAVPVGLDRRRSESRWLVEECVGLC